MLLQSTQRACYCALYLSCTEHTVEHDQSAGSTLADPGTSCCSHAVPRRLLLDPDWITGLSLALKNIGVNYLVDQKFWPQMHIIGAGDSEKGQYEPDNHHAINFVAVLTKKNYLVYPDGAPQPQPLPGHVT
ncbi:hypothetical protein K443DRAFT_15945 [Laccaria amethystina LaAM-08-1]|uniref:Uncharacterized protein n=1 Tax=Laccaria amethystina LaAM-08-1 TaxID=1095629 RepID=A0A0C9WWF0_9AGAR|nr:hypothetical protein K443DRAFT_15945 [Laccaria amethystina LaAM-08-1]